MYNPKGARTAELRSSILEVAVAHAQRVGYMNITRADIAREAGFKSITIVNWAFGTMENLRTAIMSEAVKRGTIRILADGLGNQHPVALSAPAGLRQQAEAALTR